MPNPRNSPRRITIPLLIDIIMVSDPEQIRTIESSGAVDRLHSYSTDSLPWWVRFFFRATKFHDDKRDLWFCPFESSSNFIYQKRRNYLASKVDEGYCEEDVQKIADLLRKDADEETLAHAMVQVVNRRFFGEEIPLSITRGAKNTLQNFGEIISPWKYKRAIKSREETLLYCEKALDEGVHILDIGHNIGEVVQTTAGALRTLYNNLETPIEELFTSHALTLQVPRIAVKSSRFDGLLKRPTKPGRTVFILKIAEAAAKTQELEFTFGTGGPERLCVFMDFFLAFMKDLQNELREV